MSDISQEILIQTNQVLAITMQILDEIIKIANQESLAAAERRKLNEFIQAAERSVGSPHPEVIYLDTKENCSDIDVNAIHSMLRKNNIEAYVLVDGYDMDSQTDKQTARGKIVYRAEDHEKVKECILELAAREQRRTRIPMKELCKSIQSKGLCKVENLTHSQVLALQRLSKTTGRTFVFAAVPKDTFSAQTEMDKESSPQFDVYCTADNMAQLEKALIQLSFNQQTYNGIMLDGSDIESSDKVVLDTMNSYSLYEDGIYLASSLDNNKYIQISRDSFAVFSDGRILQSASKDLLNDPQEYNTELLYALQGLKDPVMLTKEEWDGPDRNTIANEKAAKIYTKKFVQENEYVDLQEKVYHNLSNFLDNANYLEIKDKNKLLDNPDLYQGLSDEEKTLIKPFVEKVIQEDMIDIEHFKADSRETRETVEKYYDIVEKLADMDKSDTSQSAPVHAPEKE